MSGNTTEIWGEEELKLSAAHAKAVESGYYIEEERAAPSGDISAQFGPMHPVWTIYRGRLYDRVPSEPSRLLMKP